jgi:SAM-dependent methyltransferase
VRPELVNELRCPTCRGPLTLQIGDCIGEEIETGALVCTCHRVYHIRSGIPRLLPERLTVVDARIAAAFSYEWTHFKVDYEQVREHFLDWIAPLQPADFRGKRVIDAGCGMGRHAREAARFGAAKVFALDLSDAVAVARQYTRGEPAVHVMQADLRRPPLRGDIDLVYSIGVLNQLPDPQEGFDALAGLLRPGGALFAWVYAAEAGRFVSDILNPLRARFTSHLPLPALRVLTWLPAAVLALLCRALPRLGRRHPTVQSSLPWFAYFEELGRFPFSLLHCMLFDQLVAPAARYCGRDEFRRYFERAGLTHVETSLRHGNGWRGIGQAPSPPAAGVALR